MRDDGVEGIAGASDSLVAANSFGPGTARVGPIDDIPLRIGAVDLGVLVLGGSTPRASASQEVADSFLVGDLVARLSRCVTDALVRLRANAFATKRPIDKAAVEVVAGRRSFEELQFDQSLALVLDRHAKQIF